MQIQRQSPLPYKYTYLCYVSYYKQLSNLRFGSRYVYEFKTGGQRDDCSGCSKLNQTGPTKVFVKQTGPDQTRWTGPESEQPLLSNFWWIDWTGNPLMFEEQRGRAGWDQQFTQNGESIC